MAGEVGGRSCSRRRCNHTSSSCTAGRRRFDFEGSDYYEEVEEDERGDFGDALGAGEEH